MAITLDDFDKVWASTSPLTPYEFSESNYKEGWNFVGGTPPSRQMWDFLQKNNDEKMKYITDNYATTDYVDEEIRQHGNLPVGYEYFQMNPNIPQGSLPLFGGEYSRDTYSDLWDWVQTQTGYLKTEAEWQTLSTANNGNVPFYSSGDGSTTFRVPSLHCWIKGSDGSAQLVGSYLEAGLPNITGSFSAGVCTAHMSYATGAFEGVEDGHAPGVGDGGFGFDFDASRSSSIYGNANTVQPESIVGMWLVKAYGTVADTGKIDEQQYIDDRMQALRTEMAQGDVVSAPVGCVQAFAGSSTPSGWLLCDGSAVSRTTYAELYAVIGDTYGAGDGSTTFNLPNLVDKFVEGSATAGTVKNAGLPNITGEVSLQCASVWDASGVFTKSNTRNESQVGSLSSGDGIFTFDASLSSSVYGNSNTVQPPSVTMRYIIKY